MAVVKKAVYWVILVPFLATAILLGAWALERFIIPQEEDPVGGVTSSDVIPDIPPEKEPVPTVLEENSEEGRWFYQSEECTITITRSRREFIGKSSGKKVYSNVYIADITINEGWESCLKRLKTEGFGTGTKYRDDALEIAKQGNAILAMTGDQYGFVKTGMEIIDSTVYRHQERSPYFVSVTRDNVMSILKASEYASKEKALSLVENGTKFTLDFGPAVLIDGVLVTDFSGYSNIGNWNPRSGIGFAAQNHFYFVVIDGSRNGAEVVGGESGGAGLAHLGEIFKELGCTQGFNLDGGASVTMIFNGKKINNIYGRTDLSDLVAIVEIDNK